MDDNRKKQDSQDQVQKVQKDLRTVAKMSGMSDSEIDDAFSEPSDRAIKLCDALIESVPEFKTYRDFGVVENNGKEDPFAQFGIFGRFLTGVVQSSSEDDPLIEKAFSFINSAYNDIDDKFVRSMLATEVLENLTVSEKTTSIARSNLKDQALSQFEKAVTG